MAVTERTMKATPRQIDEALRDGWNFADWVVGAVHVRGVDPQWPQPGSNVQHRLGAWPLVINDATEVVAYEPEKRLDLRARLWPFGEAEVSLQWEQNSPGTCRVRMEEQFVHGPALTLRNQVADTVLHSRNRESLERLEHLTQKYPA